MGWSPSPPRSRWRPTGGQEALHRPGPACRAARTACPPPHAARSTASSRCPWPAAPLRPAPAGHGARTAAADAPATRLHPSEGQLAAARREGRGHEAQVVRERGMGAAARAQMHGISITVIDQRSQHNPLHNDANGPSALSRRLFTTHPVDAACTRGGRLVGQPTSPPHMDALMHGAPSVFPCYRFVQLQ